MANTVNDGLAEYVNNGRLDVHEADDITDKLSAMNSLKYNSKSASATHSKCEQGTLHLLSHLLTQNVRFDNIYEQHGHVPTIPINDLRGEEALAYSREECAIRRSLAALYRLIDLHGWTHSIYNHISVRSPDNQHHFLINPFGLLYHEIQASALIKIDQDGNVVQQGSTVLGVNKAGWMLHSALHSARPDINCIIHIHLPDVIAVSCIRVGLLPVSPEANELLACGVRYHEYKGILVNESEALTIKEDLGPKAKVLFLRNHGVAVAASSVSEAWYLIKRVVTACQTQLRMLQLTGASNLLVEFKSSAPEEGRLDTVEHRIEGEQSELSDGGIPVANGQAHSDSGDASWTQAELEFEAEMRVLDSAGFRTGHVYRQPNLLRRPHIGSTWAGDTLGDQLTGADLLTTDFSATEFSAADDVASAEAAGAKQVAKIAESVKANRLKSAQRKQWLSDKHDPTAPGMVTSSMIGSPGSIRSAQYSPVLVKSFETASSIVTPVRRLSGGDTNETEVALSNGHSPKVSRPARDSFIPSKSATLPANVQHLAASNTQTTNTLQYSNGEHEKPKADKKVKKIGSFRMPSFSRKKKH